MILVERPHLQIYESLLEKKPRQLKDIKKIFLVLCYMYTYVKPSNEFCSV